MPHLYFGADRTDKPTFVDNTIPTPAYVLEEAKLLQNLEKIRYVQQQADVNIILALKAFALWKVFPLMSEYLAGATASSLNEARLIAKHFRTQPDQVVKAHTYSPAYIPTEIDQLIKHSSHITFNSVNQYLLYKEKCIGKVSCGLRVNPEYSPVETDLYNPAAKGSRLGVTAESLSQIGLLAGIEGLHVHVLCESDSYDFEKVLAVFEQKFGTYLPHIKWVNFGGGHLMTHKNYDIAHLIATLQAFKKRYPHLEVVLEPGSAIVWETGVLKATVLDIVHSGDIPTAILDISFTCHAPDTLEMPYRPKIVGATDYQAQKPSYRLGGVSCLAGDYLEAYSFERPLQVGDPLIFLDMIHYTTVKTTMFNGVAHPSIYWLRKDGTLDCLRRYTHQDYEQRMC